MTHRREIQMLFLERRKVLFGVLAGFAAGTVAGAGGHRIWAALGRPKAAFRDVVEEVLPREGIPTGVFFGDALQKVIAAGVLMPSKFRSVYAKKGGMPPWVAALLAGSSDTPIRLTASTASDLLNLLWPIGLATRAPFNADSPTNGPHLPRLASTAGWTLGREANGASYFDKVDALTLNPAQAALVQQVAERTYRPCCDNSALFQDCNHGSAMLGLLELAASQGMGKAKLEQVALAANSFWFPREYLKTALFFAIFEQRSWEEVAPEELLGARYSSASGWHENVNIALQMTNLIPRQSLIRMKSALCRI
jgi:hypothetical protein